ncbi:MAG: hypothetical protein NTX45_27110 [Proteobacteria bacterium]|nr:hypothetical protein [Pseudomonadota bacterium]
MNPSYHEKETILCKSNNPQVRKKLHNWLKQRGYKSEDDFYFLKRKGKIQSWQSDSLMSVDVLLNENEVYETEDDIQEGNSSFWDTLKISYLMASHPREYISVFVNEIMEISNTFNLTIQFHSQEKSIDLLSTELNQIADELEQNWGGAGSKSLAIMIQLE